MKDSTAEKSARKRATALLDWLTSFLPTAIPLSLDQAILDDSGDVNALLWHRSELENVLQKHPSSLTTPQKLRLKILDTKIRQSALLIVGAEKGELRRFRQGHYDHSHWWWYLDELLHEEALAGSQAVAGHDYGFSKTTENLLKVAETGVEYRPRSPKSKKARASRSRKHEES